MDQEKFHVTTYMVKYTTFSVEYNVLEGYIVFYIKKDIMLKYTFNPLYLYQISI